MSYKRATRFTEEETLAPCDVWDVTAWYLVRVPGPKVFEAAAVIERLGVKVWAPLASGWRKVGRGRFKLRQVPVNRPAFFNYIFVGMSGPADWSRLAATGYMRAVVAVGTATGPKPYAIAPYVVNAAMARQRRGVFHPGRTMRKIASVAANDVARVIDEDHSWWGHEIAVKAVGEVNARVIGEILGKTVEFEIAIDALRKAS